MGFIFFWVLWILIALWIILSETIDQYFEKIATTKNKIFGMPPKILQ